MYSSSDAPARKPLGDAFGWRHLPVPIASTVHVRSAGFSPYFLIRSRDTG